MTEAGATEQLAEFVSAVDYDDLPAEVVTAVVGHVVDQAGIQLACSTLPWTSIVRQYAARYGPPGPAVVVGTGERLDAEFAAMVNASSGHGFEMDDYGSGTMMHAGCIAVPTALAVGEEVGGSGKELLAAVAVGFELIVRLALATMPTMLVQRGFHETAVHGVFGAAAAAGRLLEQDRDELLMSLALAASHAAGTCEYTQTGGEVKRYHAGIGAAGGIRSARLARLGLTGPPTALEGRRGVLQAFSPQPRPEALTDQLGDRWQLLHHVSMKPYCCSGSIICLIDALRELMTEYGLGADDVKAVRVGASGHSLLHIGAVGPEPRDVQQAQFSAHFSLALAAVKGANDMQTYLDAAANGFSEESVISFARRIHLEQDDEVERELAERGYLGKVSVETTDGRRLDARAYGRGSGLRPLTEEDLEAKFRRNAQVVLPPRRIEELLATIRSLGQAKRLDELSAALVGPQIQDGP